MKTARKLFLPLFLLLSCVLVAVAHATEVVATSVPSTDGVTDFLNTPFQELQLNGLTLIVVAKLLGEAYSAVRKGGGLRRIILSFWFGENVPKPIADDYKAELKP